MRSCCLLIAAVLPIMAQTSLFTVGVTGGAPAQTPLGQTGGMPFVAGPTVDVRISSRLSIETGLMFQRLGQQSDSGAFLYPNNSLTPVSSTVSSTQTARALDVPLLAKFRLRRDDRAWSPFLTLGPTIRRTSLQSLDLSTIVAGTSTTSVVQPALNLTRADWSVDPSLGAGIDFKTGRFHLDPEVRYSYWTAGFPIRRNQVDFLLGFRF